MFKWWDLTTGPVFGIAIGSMVLAPISEMYGRRPVYLVSMSIFTVLIIPCGLATSLAEVVVVRFFGALAGAAMVANSPGTIGDIVTDDYRALAFSIWSIGPFNGPTFGPIIGGFSTQYSKPLSKGKLKGILTGQQVPWLEMDQLDCYDDLWTWALIFVYAERNIRASFATEESQAAPKGAG